MRRGDRMPVPNHLIDVDEKIQALLGASQDLTPEQFCSHHILDRVPWLFDDRGSYIEWKQKLARDLEIDPYAVCIVGSAATGFSLSPKKDLRLFGPNSDIDVAVISAYHFDVAWRKIRSLSSGALLLSRTLGRKVERHRTGLLFDGCIATDQILSSLEFGPTWANGLARAAREYPVIGHPVKARLYRDFDALRSYQMKSAVYAKEELQ